MRQDFDPDESFAWGARYKGSFTSQGYEHLRLAKNLTNQKVLQDYGKQRRARYPKTNRRHRKQLCDGNVCVGQHTCSVLKTAMERTLVLVMPTSLDLTDSGRVERARKAFSKVDLFPMSIQSVVVSLE